MAPSAHSIPSLLPWQPSERHPRYLRAMWLLDLLDFSYQADLELRICETMSGSYCWEIAYYSGFVGTLLGDTRWPSFQEAERDLLYSLARHLHPEARYGSLPASLPPLAGPFSAVAGKE